MKTWYLVEDNGNLLTMTAEAKPGWFSLSGPGHWRPSIVEAIEAKRLGLQETVDSAKRELERVQGWADRFERNVRAAGLVIERGGPML